MAVGEGVASSAAAPTDGTHAVDALGPDRVWCVMLPSPYTSRDSLDDAAECARLLGCRLDTIGIDPAMQAFDAMLAPLFTGRNADTAEENIQSRIRGLTLMALSNKFGPMLLTTGNKSEMSVGYATIYGDMNGGFNPIMDMLKMRVYELADWRNKHRPADTTPTPPTLRPSPGSRASRSHTRTNIHTHNNNTMYMHTQ